MEGRRGMRKKGESLPFLQEPTLGRAEGLLAQRQCQPPAKGPHWQLPCPFDVCCDHLCSRTPLLLIFQEITSSFGLRLRSTMSNRGYAFLRASMVTTCLNPRLVQTIKECCGDWFVWRFF